MSLPKSFKLNYFLLESYEILEFLKFSCLNFRWRNCDPKNRTQINFLSILFFRQQLRKLLSRECDLIYECKVCRNIFRSLTNFISHKRVYCRSSFNATDHFHFRDNGFQVQDISTIIQAEQEINNNPNGAAGMMSGTDDKSKDLSGIVERLLWKQHQSRTSNLSDFYEQISTTRNESSQQTLKLNRVNDSEVAVYQSLQMDNENSNMMDEVS